MEELDVEYDKDLIIPRALFATGPENFEESITKLERLYPKETILAELQATEERISNEVCLLVAKRYGAEPFYRWKYSNKIDLSQIFPGYVFWDADLKNLDVYRDRGLIIPRALFATDEQNFETNIQKLENLYTKETILTILQSTRENISNKICEMIAKRYKVPVFYRWR